MIGINNALYCFGLIIIFKDIVLAANKKSLNHSKKKYQHNNMVIKQEYTVAQIKGVPFLIETVQIKLKSGILHGNKKNVKNGKSYFNFQGIPFAVPPLGDLRFKDPVPFKKWSGFLNATTLGSNCVELTLRQITYRVIGNEDCLYLNVYTPQNPIRIKQKLPVMVWIYGGSFREGSADIYGPDYLIQNNVILVTFNYRIGFFGFLSTEDKYAPGNYGMKDMVLALKWVKNNIAEFGGDPNKVTLFGESAGAAAIGYLLVSRLSRKLFNAVIMQSGSPLCAWALHRNPRKVAFDLGIAMGFTTNNSVELLKYLRAVDLPSAHAPMINVDFLNFGETFQNGGPFGPVMESNSINAFISEDVLKAFKKGRFVQVPILIGVNSQEAKYFTSIIPLARSLFFLYDISPSSLVRESMNIRSSSDKSIVGKKVRQYYFKSQHFISGTDAEYAEFMSDDLFIRPITKTAKFLSKYVPVYFYVYDFEGSLGKWWINFASKDSQSIHGVAHATELWYLWRTPLTQPQLNGEDEELASQRLVRLWTNFAKFGNPTIKKETLLGNLTWPKVNGAAVDYFYIGKNLQIRKNFKERNIEFWESLYQNFSKGPYETY